VEKALASLSKDLPAADAWVVKRSASGSESQKHAKDALMDAARRLDQTPLLDTSDGSSSWYHINHEEGILTDSNGTVLEHVRSGDDPDRIAYDSRALDEALNGGLVMHSHPREFGGSFSGADLEFALCDSNSSRGMLLVVTTRHPIGDKLHDVRYTVDTRERAKLPVGLTRRELEAMWNRHSTEVVDNLSSLADDSSVSSEELYAEHFHRVVQNVCDEVGVNYHREIVK
jgi:hypothetical protein